MMANNFKKALLLLCSAATIGLAGCGEVTAELPKALQDEKIINIAEELTGNTLQDIYESLVSSGDSNSERILNKILFAYGESYFGKFYDDGNGLVDVFNDNTKAEAFLSKQKAFTKKEEVVDFANAMVTAIRKSFWDARNNSSYQERSVFYEALFYRAQVNNLYLLEDIAAPKSNILNGEHTYEDVDLYFTDILVNYKDYIERSLLPTIYRRAIVKDYLIKNNYGVLGRSYARKVQFIALPDISSSAAATQNLVRAFCELSLEADGVSDEHRDLRYLDRLYAGTVAADDAFATAIYTRAGWTPSAFANIAGTTLVDESKVYSETLMGAIVKDYNEIVTDRNLTGTTTDFTGSGAYTKEIGLELKELDVIKASKVTEGWFTSSSMSGLLSDIKDRLFKITVANDVDNPNIKDADGNGKGTFGYYVNGSYYMVPEKFERTEEHPYAIYDKSGSTWYICRVDQAVKTSKLSVERADANYDADDVGLGFGEDGKMTLNQVSWEVADLSADTDSYKNAANQAVVKAIAIAYHDDDVYNYFKKTFPDLFD